MSFPKPLDRYDRLLKPGDKIKFIGEPVTDVVYYTPDMRNMLNDGKIYTIDMIDKHIGDFGRKSNIIRAAGWNWDIKNIMKTDGEIKYPKPKKIKPVKFDENLLDI